MSSTPLPVIVVLIISAYILSTAFGGSRAEEQLAGATPPRSDNERSSAVNSGGGISLKQKLGEQMKSELLGENTRFRKWVGVPWPMAQGCK